MLEGIDKYTKPLEEMPPCVKITNGFKDYPFDNRSYIPVPTIESKYESLFNPELKNLWQLRQKFGLIRHILNFVNTNNITYEFTNYHSSNMWPLRPAYDPHLFVRDPNLLIGGMRPPEMTETIHQVTHCDDQADPVTGLTIRTNPDLDGMFKPCSPAVL